MHKRYLRECRPNLYNQLVHQGKLGTYLADLNDQAQEWLEAIILQMKRIECIAERLKAQNQMEWVGRMNSTSKRAEETIMAEMIFI
jgi:hypothetical protein